jgi:chemotaxis protein MotB
MSETPVIRIVKKKVAHGGGHHGGSWKVAYADFVTAMMAFFLVMWIISMDQETREEIQSYFNDPASASNSPAGISKLAAGGRSAIALGTKGVLNGKIWGQMAKEAQKDKLDRTKEAIQQQLAGRPDLSGLKQHLEINLTPAGMVIELIEASDALFFRSGSAELSPQARSLLAIIARELSQIANPIVIEGHTDSMQYASKNGYTNWELSADRANAARRAMQNSGLRAGQVMEVRGYADSKLRDPRRPTSAINRRVSILINYVEPPGSTPDEDGGEEKAPIVKQPIQLNIRPQPVAAQARPPAAH